MNDIEKAMSMIKCHKYYDYFDTVYPFTTENINGYINKFDLKDKKLLTVGSSGDQVLNSIVVGSKDITLIDINPYAKYYLGLKKGALNVLDKQQFMDYFHYKNTNDYNYKVFDYTVYLKIAPYLTDEEKLFWDTLYKEYSGIDIRETLFSMDEDDIDVIKEMNTYLKYNNYDILKKNIKDCHINFINSNIKDDITGKYDYIFLSNIAAYIDAMYEGNVLEEFKKTIDKLSNNLDDNGAILLAYLYDYEYFTKYIPSKKYIYDLNKVNKVFNNKVKLYSFDGINNIYNNSKTKDAILVYKKSGF